MLLIAILSLTLTVLLWSPNVAARAVHNAINDDLSTHTAPDVANFRRNQFDADRTPTPKGAKTASSSPSDLQNFLTELRSMYEPVLTNLRRSELDSDVTPSSKSSAPSSSSKSSGSTGSKSGGSKQAGTTTSGTKPAGSKPSGTKPVGSKPSDTEADSESPSSGADSKSSSDSKSGSKPQGSKNSSGSKPKPSTTKPSTSTNGRSKISLCKPGHSKRSEDDIFQGPETTFSSLDPQGTFKVDGLLERKDGLGDKIGGGSFGTVHQDTTNPDLLIKHIAAQPGRGLKDQEVISEMDVLKLVQQYGGKYKYKTTISPKTGKPQLTDVWVWMKKVKGQKFNDIVPRFTDAAKRKVFVDKVVDLLNAKALEYAKSAKIMHMDMTAENVLVVMNGDNVESLDLIDWGIVEELPPAGTECTAEPAASIKSAISATFNRFY